ncbi:unnamed protein product [Rotaria sp. Silwood2]|nr:unnamed protein product [Rotaria sp. Silwood2]CAF4511593.1 unnamed protein product [Rotaria sp. Silwood2]
MFHFVLMKDLIILLLSSIVLLKIPGNAKTQENLPQEDLLKAAIQFLPKPIDNVTPVKIDQINGQRIEVIKREDESIR